MLQPHCFPKVLKFSSSLHYFFTKCSRILCCIILFFIVLCSVYSVTVAEHQPAFWALISKSS